MRAPAGRSASFAPSRATSASRGSSRGGMAASVIPCAAPVGRSLSECTAKSTSPRSRLSRNALTKTPVPPICVSCSLLTSPSVVTPTISTGRPVRSVRSLATSPDCATAIGLRRLPSRKGCPPSLAPLLIGDVGSFDFGACHCLNRTRVEVEKHPQRGLVFFAARRRREFLYPDGRRMQQLVYHSAHRLGYFFQGVPAHAVLAAAARRAGRAPRRRPSPPSRAAPPRSASPGRHGPRTRRRRTPPRRSRGRPRPRPRRRPPPRCRAARPCR